MATALGGSDQTSDISIPCRLNRGFAQKETLHDQKKRAQKLIFDLSFDSLPPLDDDGKRSSSCAKGKGQGAPLVGDFFRLNSLLKPKDNKLPPKDPKEKSIREHSSTSLTADSTPKSLNSSESSLQKVSPKADPQRRKPIVIIPIESKSKEASVAATETPRNQSSPSDEQRPDTYCTPLREGSKTTSLTDIPVAVTPSSVRPVVKEKAQSTRGNEATPYLPDTNPDLQYPNSSATATIAGDTTPGSTNRGSSSADLEKQLQDLHQLLKQNQEQFEALRNENAKLSKQLVERTSCEGCDELKDAVSILQQEVATKNMIPGEAQEENAVASQEDTPCSSCQKLQHSFDALKKETQDWGTQIQESMQVEKESLKQQMSEQIVDVQSIGKELQSAIEEARDSPSQKEVMESLSKELKMQMEKQLADIRNAQQEQKQEAQAFLLQFQAEAKESLENVQQIDNRDTLSQQGAQLHSATEECKSMVSETNAKLSQLIEMVQKNEKDKASLRAEFLKKLEDEEDRIRGLEQQQESLQVTKEEIHQKLEQQIFDCGSLRQELQEGKEQRKESVCKLQQEATATNSKLHEIELSLTAVKKEHQDAIKKLEDFDEESRQLMQQSWEGNSAALTLAHDRIADLEETVRQANKARLLAEAKHAKKVLQQEKKIAEMKKDHEALQEVLAWTKTEKDTLKGLMAEKGEVLKETKRQLKDVEDSLEAVAAEKDLALDQLMATTEKCMTAVTATEEMKALLEKDNEQIEELHSMVAKLENERDALTSSLNSASKELEAQPDPEDTIERRDSFDFDMGDLLNGMNMPKNFEDSMMFLGSHQRGTLRRQSSINALEELEADLRNLLDQSIDVIPQSRKSSMFKAASIRNRKGSIVHGGRQMSVLVGQKQRDSAEDEVLSQIRGLN